MRWSARVLTDQEASKLERLCIESDTRLLSREETIRVRILQGFHPEYAEWLADAGGRPRSAMKAIDKPCEEEEFH